MRIDLSRNLTHDMRTRKMAKVPQTVVCQSAQSAEVNDLTDDYNDFCQHLRDQGITESVPLSEFAIWRNEELLASDGWVNPLPAIN